MEAYLTELGTAKEIGDLYGSQKVGFHTVYEDVVGVCGAFWVICSAVWVICLYGSTLSILLMNGV